MGVHKRSCTGPRTNTQLPFKCEECPRSYSTFAGKQVHRARQHPQEYQRTLPEKSKGFSWSELELRTLAEDEIRLSKEHTDRINIRLQATRTHRTVQAISTKRKTEAYRTLLANIQEEQSSRPIEEDQNHPENEVGTANTEAEIDAGPIPLDSYANIKETEEVLREYISHPERNDVDIKLKSYISTCLEDPEGMERSWEELKASLQERNVSNDTRSTAARPRRRNRVYRPPEPNRRPNRNTRRAQYYKRTQEEYGKDPGNTIKKILNNTLGNTDVEITPNITDVEDVYRERLERNPFTDTESIAPIQEINQDDQAYKAYTTNEIKTTLKEMKADTAPGPDKWMTLTLMKELGAKTVCKIINCWWHIGRIPESEKRCRTILIYKKGDPSNVNNWRPITIANIMTRVYAKCLDKRLRRIGRIHHRQKAFVPLDGCFENAKILTTAIKRSWKTKSEANIVLLDLAKAFDTVPHSSIARALERQGIHPCLKDTIKDLYKDASTTIKSGNEVTPKITINSGVKQGCPLSPTLFNMLMDELLKDIDELNTGIGITETTKVGIMAFADDLVILTDSAPDMEIALRRCAQFFERRNLSVNTSKCQSLRLLPVKDKKSMKNIERIHRYFNQEEIPSITYTTLAKYLGIYINPRGNVILQVEKLDEWLERLTEAPLKPWQKCYGLRTIIIPKLMHQLRLAGTEKCGLRNLDRKLRKAYKRILHLPEWTSTAWLHHSKGGRLPELTDLMTRSGHKAALKMAESDDPVTSSLSEELLQRSIQRLDSSGLSSRTPASIKKEQEVIKEEKILMTANGRARSTMLTKNSITRDYLWNGCQSGRTNINSLRILSGTLPTRLNQHRGATTQENIRCRRCGASAETDLHVLNECHANKDIISRRHNDVQKKLGKELSRVGYEVQLERTYRTNQLDLKPDITAKKDERTLLFEITIPYESSHTRLKEMEVFKKNKYRILENETTEIVAIAIGSGGTVLSSTLKKLKKCGITKKVARALSITALAGSAAVWSLHERGGVR